MKQHIIKREFYYHPSMDEIKSLVSDNETIVSLSVTPSKKFSGEATFKGFQVYLVTEKVIDMPSLLTT